MQCPVITILVGDTNYAIRGEGSDDQVRYALKRENKRAITNTLVTGLKIELWWNEPVTLQVQVAKNCMRATLL